MYRWDECERQGKETKASHWVRRFELTEGGGGFGSTARTCSHCHDWQQDARNERHVPFGPSSNVLAREKQHKHTVDPSKANRIGASFQSRLFFRDWKGHRKAPCCHLRITSALRAFQWRTERVLKSWIEDRAALSREQRRVKAGKLQGFLEGAVPGNLGFVKRWGWTCTVSCCCSPRRAPDPPQRFARCHTGVPQFPGNTGHYFYLIILFFFS